MSEQRPVICIGEVTIEFARGRDGRFGISCNGDTFNTAIYLARAGIPTAFATALGDDPFSDGLVSLAAAEGVSTDLIVRVAGRLPGLTVVDIEQTGARRLYAWCDTAPARELFELPQWSRVAEGLLAARMIYFSGITLSLYSNVAIGRFLAALELARQNGATVVFDGNFRPLGWKGDLARTRTVFMEALKRSDIALPAYDDEAALWGDPSPEATVERMRAFGIGEIVVKNGPNSALVATPLPRSSPRRRNADDGGRRGASACGRSDPPSGRAAAARRGRDALGHVPEEDAGFPNRTCARQDLSAGGLGPL
jgi:2-dehydro-3-deoxygluconokinase